MVPHSGVETTVKEVLKHIIVIGGLRNLIRKIRKRCTKCRIMQKKVVELGMSTHPVARTLIAPPFLFSYVRHLLWIQRKKVQEI